jgi:hypothetical protein
MSAHTAHRLPFESFLSILSFQRNPCSWFRLVQWWLIVKTDYWTEGDRFEGVSCQIHG